MNIVYILCILIIEYIGGEIEYILSKDMINK